MQNHLRNTEEHAKSSFNNLGVGNESIRLI